MKKLGLIGGIGPESSISYYREIVFGVQKRLGRKQFPPLTVESLDVYQVLQYCREKDMKGLIGYVSDGIANLAAAGCDFAALSGNTPHIVFDELQARSPIPLVSMPAAACGAAQKAGYHRLGLLGTFVTMRENFFKEPFIKAGIDIVTPSDAEMDMIQHKIADELEFGIVKKATQDAFRQLLQRMQAEDRIDAIVLGCTELPLAFKGLDTSVPVLDTMAIHIEVLVEQIMMNGTVTRSGTLPMLRPSGRIPKIL